MTGAVSQKNSRRESPDADLLERCGRGDRRAFEELVERYQEAVYNLCYRLLSDREEANDVAQETFVRAYCSLQDFRGGKFSIWLLRIANHLCVDHLRRRRLMPLSLEEIAENGPEMTGEGSRFEAAVEQRLWVQAAVARLPLPYRQVVVLHYFEGLSCEEMAAVLQRPVNTVKTHLRRARQRLREELTKE